MSEYIHTTLLDGNFRLISLLPGEAHDKVQVLISQNRFSNNSRPKYEALSYEWGSPEDLISIDVQDGPEVSRLPSLAHLGVNNTTVWTSIRITRNLEIALRHLRLLWRYRILWIDAICIDQNNDNEKSKEIPRMGMIYRRADEVVVWLGAEAEESTLAVRCMSKIARDAEFSDEDEDDEDYDLRRIHMQQRGREGFTKKLENNRESQLKLRAEWAAIENLFHRDFFTRLWVYQELHLATKATVTVGHDTISYDDFNRAFKWIRNQIIKYPGCPISTHFKRQFARSVTEFIAPPPGNSFILSLLVRTKDLHCFDARDRFYAIFGLLGDRTGDSLIADYQETTGSIYHQWTSYLLESVWGDGLDTLDLCPCHESKIPSWVLDPSYVELPPPLSFTGADCQAGFGDIKDPNTVDVLLDDASITIYGKFLDDVEKVTSGCPLSASGEDLLSCCRAWRDEEFLSGNYIGGGTSLQAFASTLVADMLLLGRKARPDDWSWDEFYKSALQNFLQSNGGIGADWYEALLADCLPGRSFFRTKKGYMGLCHSSVTPGDRVFVVFGKSTPLAVKGVPDRSGCYRLASGECYVYGIMNLGVFLGPLPKGWGVEFMKDGMLRKRVYISPDEVPQYEDPRLGPLPSTWREVYIDANHFTEDKSTSDDLKREGIALYTQMRDKDGYFRRRIFHNLDTDEIQEFDPRLSLDALQNRKFEVNFEEEELDLYKDMIELGKTEIESIRIL